MKVPLYRGGEVVAHAVVDSEDYAWAMQYRWHPSSLGYARRYEARSDGQPGRNGRIPWRDVLMHREILGLESGDRREGDHINRDRLDNRRSNLRIVPRGANAQNVPSHRGTSSRFRGVTWKANAKKWEAFGRVDGKHRYLGYFNTEEEAAAVASASRKQHMPYAVEVQ